jgi:copper transport protein
VASGWFAPAGAHAAVIASTPAPGAHLAAAPPAVVIVFDQPVQPDDGGIVVLNSSGQDVAGGASTHPRPDTLRVALPRTLGTGAYVASYTVTSVDGHVVSGGIVFLVGRVSAGSVASLARARTSATNWVDDFGQFSTYVGVLVAAGLAFFVAFVAGAAERPRLRRWAVAAAALGAGGLVVTAAAQAALLGGGVGALAHWADDRQALGGKLGLQAAAQLVGLAACLYSLWAPRPVVRQVTAFYGLIVSAGAFVLFGHALVSPERALSTAADVVHAVFAAMWAGGVVGLVIVLRARVRAARSAGEMGTGTGTWSAGATVTPATRVRAPVGVGSARPVVPSSSVATSRTGTALLEHPADPRPVSELAGTAALVNRFSTMAGISFTCILVAGVLLGIAEVGSVANLFETGYGQILLVKMALVGVLLFLAAYNRYLLLPVLTRIGRADRVALARGWRRLLATVRLEALGMVAVLGVTSVLANGTPSNGASLPPPVPLAQSQPFPGGRISLRIEPNQALVNDWTLDFTRSDGAPADLAESVSVYLTLPAQGVGPIETDMKRVGVGRFVLKGSPNPPIVGVWQVVVQVQVSEFSQVDASFVDHVQ